MTKRAYDPEFEAILPLLPTVSDLSSVEKIQADALGPHGHVRAAARSRRRREGGPPRARPRRRARRAGPRLPAASAGAAGPRGCVFEIHGGGFMMGSIEMMDPWCQRVAAELDAVVVSVEYRLAPEHPFPAGIEDCYAALCWTAHHARRARRRSRRASRSPARARAAGSPPAPR